jgi:hypothetical protein
MRMSKVIFVTLFCLVGLTPLVWSQSQDQPLANGAAVRQNHGVPGFLDPQTGTFTTHLQTASPTVQLPNTTRVIFRLIFPISININDQPAGNSVACDVDIFTSDNSYSDSGSVVGNASGCTVTILAQWDLATPNTDTIFVSFGISSSGTGTSRRTSHALASIPVPNNGQTITEPIIDAVL